MPDSFCYLRFRTRVRLDINVYNLQMYTVIFSTLLIVGIDGYILSVTNVRVVADFNYGRVASFTRMFFMFRSIADITRSIRHGIMTSHLHTTFTTPSPRTTPSLRPSSDLRLTSTWPSPDLHNDKLREPCFLVWPFTLSLCAFVTCRVFPWSTAGLQSLPGTFLLVSRE